MLDSSAQYHLHVTFSIYVSSYEMLLKTHFIMDNLYTFYFYILLLTFTLLFMYTVQQIEETKCI